MNILEELKKEREVLRCMLDNVELSGMWATLYTERKLFDEYVAHVQSIDYAKEYQEYIDEGC